MNDIQILLTNDDGIQSPGLWAAAEALSTLGFVHVAAPRDQFSGAGRSMPVTSDGLISTLQMGVNGKNWTVYGVGGTPAQAVLHAVLEILPRKPDIVVSGINYGENVGTGITASGTVGAALEAAAAGIPALAVSRQVPPEEYLNYSREFDFSAAAHFTLQFARLLTQRPLPADVHVLKIDVPAGASADTPWEVTRLSRLRYFEPLAPERKSWDVPAQVGYRISHDPEQDTVDSDVHALWVKKIVSVTPLSLDMTSRIDLKVFEQSLKQTGIE
jgi:5'-nucleotidase